MMDFQKIETQKNLVTFLQYFVFNKGMVQKNAQESVPEYLDEIIEKNLLCLNSLNNSNKNIPLFNGSTEKEIGSF